MNKPKALFNITYTPVSVSKNISIERQAKFFQERSFYTMTSDYNYFTYTLQGKKCVKNKDANEYFTRTGSGLFGLNGFYNEQDIEELKSALKKTKSIIWHGFISFDAETSKGFTTEAQAQKLLKQTFGGFLKRAGFAKDNVVVYASLHADKPHHHHIHFAFFEKEPKHIDKNGNVGYRKVGKISPIAIDNYMVSVNMHLDEHSEDYYSARDRAMERLKLIRGEVSNGVTAKMTLNNAIDELIKVLPTKGRLSYNSKNMAEIRPQIDNVAKLLTASDAQANFNHKKMLEEFERIKRTTMQIANDNRMIYVDGKRMSGVWIEQNAVDSNGNIKPEFVDSTNVDYFDQLYDDYKSRIGNIVIGMCKDIKKNCLFRTQPNRVRSSVNDKKIKIQSDIVNTRKRKAISKTINFLRRQNVGVAQANFIKTVQQMEEQIKWEQNGGKDF